jgi:hypothetical protein
MNSGNCWKCSRHLTPLDYGRSDRCLGCGWDTRVCKNCIHYDLSYNNYCKENQADRVVEKEKSNFCDYFSPRSGPGGTATSKSDLVSAAEALFKKK